MILVAMLILMSVIVRMMLVSILILVLTTVLMPVTMTVTVMMTAATQQPRADNVHRQPETGDRDGLGEMNRHRLEQPCD